MDIHGSTTGIDGSSMAVHGYPLVIYVYASFSVGGGVEPPRLRTRPPPMARVMSMKNESRSWSSCTGWGDAQLAAAPPPDIGAPQAGIRLT